jgi:ABC-2 type transport system ATP-binding protein
VNAVELKNVTKTFGQQTAVGDLSLAVPAGSIYGFIGPNGSGKTTTMRMIVNIFYPDRGEISVFGLPPGTDHSGRIGYLPEERGLYKNMTVRETLEFYASLKSPADIRTEIDAWIERLEAGSWVNKKIEELSKGMSQKVQFLTCVIPRPDLLILDEPFTGLDPVNADAIRSAVLELRAQGTTVILSTHDMNIAEQMCDFILMIFRGKKVLDGTLASIQEAYGLDTLRVQCRESIRSDDGLPGVLRVNDFGRQQELQLSADAHPQQVLAALLSRTEVYRFEIVTPSLHDIFVRIAGPEARENGHA